MRERSTLSTSRVCCFVSGSIDLGSPYLDIQSLLRQYMLTKTTSINTSLDRVMCGNLPSYKYELNGSLELRSTLLSTHSLGRVNRFVVCFGHLGFGIFGRFVFFLSLPTDCFDFAHHRHDRLDTQAAKSQKGRNKF